MSALWCRNALAQEACTVAQATGAAVSARLAAAQEELQQRRRQRRQERLEQRLPVLTDTHGRLTSPRPSTTNKSDTDQHPARADGGEPRGDAAPLRWESEPFSKALRLARHQQEAAARRCQSERLQWLPKRSQAACAGDQPVDKRWVQPAQPVQQRKQPDPTVFLYPDLAIAMLRKDLAAVGRVWLLLRHLDVEGRGWLAVSMVRERLTGKSSPLRVCGWRQLRNLLTQGEGTFWQRETGPSSEARLWLRSTARVAATLGVPRLTTRAVTLDVTVLLESIGTVRAHFYASFHSGRRNSNPISRECLQEITGVSRRSQHAYEERTGMQRQKNWAVGPQHTQKAAQERAWQQGNAVFKFNDYQGKTGKAGSTYLAWQLPNSYSGPHEQQTTAHRKRINRQLVDLFTKGITGNGKEKVDQKDASKQEAYPDPRFYEHGQAAARAYNRSPASEIYWQSHATLNQYRVWHVLPAHPDMQ